MGLDATVQPLSKPTNRLCHPSLLLCPEGLVPLTTWSLSQNRRLAHRDSHSLAELPDSLQLLFRVSVLSCPVTEATLGDGRI